MRHTLPNGTTILISKHDLPILQNWRWWIDAGGYVSGYVQSRRIRLHRYLMGDPPGRLVDHRNRNKIDNRRCNLRVTDRSGNAINSKFRSHNTSGFRGVSLCRDTGKWRGEIRVSGKRIKLGRFDCKKDAARAYDIAAKKYHGEYAVLNFG